MGQKHNAVRHKIIDLNDAREVQYWTQRLGVSRSELKTLSETTNKLVSVEPSVLLSKPTPQGK